MLDDPQQALAGIEQALEDGSRTGCTLADVVLDADFGKRYGYEAFGRWCAASKEQIKERKLGVQEMAAPSKMIRAALDYINEHFHENISPMDVAENINISKNYLCDIFKKELGVTFINYVTNLRIEKAKEYLTGTDMKMYEVSNAVGYNDYAYFSQIFKKHTGKTLSSYRKKK